MIKAFRAYIKAENLFLPEERILLAVSGGVDSVVMVHLFAKAGFQFGIAHSNFTLRGKESDEDEQFVKRLAESFAVPFYSNHFDTAGYAEKQKISIQMAARNLRYAWFEKLMNAHGYACVATAHHLDDQAETFFINLIRGTGISGLHGILPRQGRVIRPLMFTNREKILKCAVKENLAWREDRSNSSRKYLRNRLRLDVLAELSKISPNFSVTLNETILKLRDVEKIYSNHISGVSNDLIQHTADGDLISIDYLYEYVPHGTYLFELLKPYNFTYPVVAQIVRSLDASSGKVFFSPTHRLLRDRENFIIQPLETIRQNQHMAEPIAVLRGTSKINFPVKLTFTEISPSENLPLGVPATACLDLDRLAFPLTLRKWNKGDWFIPFGLKGRKKLSNFFIDLKLSIAEKDHTWILASGDDIVWVIGYRIDNRFRITAKTKTALVVCLNDKTAESDGSCCGNSLLFC